MINLKLADYGVNKEKFERFLELEEFLLGKDRIYLPNAIQSKLPERQQFQCYGNCFFKDEKDPLNRFNGLFNGRTYGEGRFVLMIGFALNDRLYFQDDVMVEEEYDKEPRLIILNFIPAESRSCCYQSNAFGILHDFGDQYSEDLQDLVAKGNLHELPDLYKTIKKQPLRRL